MDKGTRGRGKRGDGDLEEAAPAPKATKTRPMPRSKKEALNNHEEDAPEQPAGPSRNTKEASPPLESSDKAKTGGGPQKGGKKPVVRNPKGKDEESKKAPPPSHETSDHSDHKSDSIQSDNEVEVQGRKPQAVPKGGGKKAPVAKPAPKGKQKERSPPPPPPPHDEEDDDEEDDDYEDDDEEMEDSDVVGGLAHKMNHNLRVESEESGQDTIGNSSGEIHSEEQEEESSPEKPKKVATVAAASKAGGAGQFRNTKEVSPPLETLDKAKTGGGQQKGGKKPIVRNPKGRDEESKKAPPPSHEISDHSDHKSDSMQSDNEVEVQDPKPQAVPKGGGKKGAPVKPASNGKQKSPPQPSSHHHGHEGMEEGEIGGGIALKRNHNNFRIQSDESDIIENSLGELQSEEHEEEASPEKPKKVATVAASKAVGGVVGQSRNTKEVSPPLEQLDKAKTGGGPQKGGKKPVARNPKGRDEDPKKAPAPSHESGNHNDHKSDSMQSDNEVEVQGPKPQAVPKGGGKKAPAAKPAPKGKQKENAPPPAHSNDDDDEGMDESDVVDGLAHKINHNLRVESEESEQDVIGNSSGEIQSEEQEEEASPEKPKKVAASKVKIGAAKKAGPSVANRNVTKAAAPAPKETEATRGKTAKAPETGKGKAGTAMGGTSKGKAGSTATRKETATAKDGTKAKDPRKSYALRSKGKAKLQAGL